MTEGHLRSWASRRHASNNFSLLASGVKGFIKAIKVNALQNTEALFLYPVGEGTTPVNPYWLYVSDIVTSTITVLPVPPDPTQANGTGRGAAFCDVYEPFPGRGIPFHDGIRIDKVLNTTSIALLVEITEGSPKWLVAAEI